MHKYDRCTINCQGAFTAQSREQLLAAPYKLIAYQGLPFIRIVIKDLGANPQWDLTITLQRPERTYISFESIDQEYQSFPYSKNGRRNSHHLHTSYRTQQRGQDRRMVRNYQINAVLNQCLCSWTCRSVLACPYNAKCHFLQGRGNRGALLYIQGERSMNTSCIETWQALNDVWGVSHLVWGKTKKETSKNIRCWFRRRLDTK